MDLRTREELLRAELDKAVNWYQLTRLREDAREMEGELMNNGDYVGAENLNNIAYEAGYKASRISTGRIKGLDIIILKKIIIDAKRHIYPQLYKVEGNKNV